MFFLVGLKWWMKRNCTLTVTPIHWSHHIFFKIPPSPVTSNKTFIGFFSPDNIPLVCTWRSLVMFCSICLCISGVWGECWEPGEVRAGDKVPAASVPTRCRYLGNRGGQIIILTACFHHDLFVCLSLSISHSINRWMSDNGRLHNIYLDYWNCCFKICKNW